MEPKDVGELCVSSECLCSGKAVMGSVAESNRKGMGMRGVLYGRVWGVVIKSFIVESYA
jgi:hypothetical protein